MVQTIIKTLRYRKGKKLGFRVKASENIKSLIETHGINSYYLVYFREDLSPVIPGMGARSLLEAKLLAKFLNRYMGLPNYTILHGIQLHKMIMTTGIQLHITQEAYLSANYGKIPTAEAAIRYSTAVKKRKKPYVGSIVYLYRKYNVMDLSRIRQITIRWEGRHHYLLFIHAISTPPKIIPALYSYMDSIGMPHDKLENEVMIGPFKHRQWGIPESSIVYLFPSQSLVLFAMYKTYLRWQQTMRKFIPLKTLKNSPKFHQVMSPTCSEITSPEDIISQFILNPYKLIKIYGLKVDLSKLVFPPRHSPRWKCL